MIALLKFLFVQKSLTEELKEAKEHGERLNDPEYVKSLERAYTWYGRPYVKSNRDR